MLAKLPKTTNTGYKMKKMMLVIVLFLGSMFFACSLHAGQDRAPVPFSADMNTYDTKGRIFVSPDGMRMEMTEPDTGMEVIMIENYARQVMLLCADEGEKVCTEMPMDLAFAHDDDDGDDRFLIFGEPCGEEPRESKRLGRESLQGRSVEKWSCAYQDGSSATTWYDTKLQTIIRGESDDGVFELTNIREGGVSRDLFEPPAGYSVFSMGDFFKGLQ